jgi:hypothetical protein
MWTSPFTWHFYKWLPDYYPNDPWEVIGSSGPPEGAIIPWWKQPKDQWPYPTPWEPKVLGAFPAMWFKMREDIGAPVTDPPGPWPSSPKYPPFGLTKVNTRPDQIGTKSVSTIKVHMRPAEWLEATPHPSLWAAGKYEEALKIMSRKRPIRIVNEDGSSITLKSIRHENWVRAAREAKEAREAKKIEEEALKAKLEQQAKVRQEVRQTKAQQAEERKANRAKPASEIAAKKGIPTPSPPPDNPPHHDLFS